MQLTSKLYAWMHTPLEGIGSHFIDAADSQDVRLQKRLLVGASSSVVVLTSIWGAIFFLFNEPGAGFAAMVYVVTSLAGLLFYDLRRSYLRFLNYQLCMALLLPFSQMIILGGFFNSGAVIVWSLIGAMFPLFFYPTRLVFRWWIAYFLLVVVCGLIQPVLRTHNNLPPELITGFFVMNIAVVSAIVLVILNYFIRQKDVAYRLLHLEQEKSDSLLLNVLPRQIAAVLKNDDRTIAESFGSTSILFADLVGFTPLTAEMPPQAVVSLLNEIFSQFDRLVEKYGLEKIRTIGDNYMVASGVPAVRGDHAQALACLALEMSAYLHQRPSFSGKNIEFRIGISSGPVIGGVIGRRKFVYDVWGDAVNIASRMESQGLPGRIQISEDTYHLISAEFDCEPRGQIPVKGRGDMNTYLLLGRKAGLPAVSA